MTKRVNQVLMALLIGVLFFGAAGLNATSAYAQAGTIYLPLAATQNNDLVTGSSSTAPIFVSGAANKTCQELAVLHTPGSTWIELKADPNPVGAGPFQYSDGVLTVQITNASESGFDWSSNIGVDAVFVKGGSDGSNLYIYDFAGDPNTESIGDTGLVIPSNNAISHIAFCYDVEVQVTKTATATYTKTHTWDIAKSVNPTAQSAFAGDPVSWTWTVTLSDTVQEGNYSVSGQITVNNPTAVQVSGTLTDKLSDNTTANITGCSGDGVTWSSPTLTVGAGKTATCTYTASPGGKTATKNTATFTAGGKTYTGEAALTWTPTVVNGTAKVEDDQEPDFNPSGLTVTAGQGPWTWTELQQQTCSTDAADYEGDGKYSVTLNNNAKVTGSNGQIDTAFASTTYTCYAPVVSKDATATWEKDVQWTLTKDVTPPSAKRFAGESADFQYTVLVTKTETNKYTVAGTISVANPAGAPGSITVDLVDQLAPATNAVVDCDANTLGAQSSVTVAAGATESCTYTGELASNTDGTNTVTATFKGIDFTATAPYVFGAAVLSGEPESITVQDVYNGGNSQTLTMVNNAATYTRTETCSSDPADYVGDGFNSTTYPNTASIVETTGDNDSESVTLECYAPVVSKDAATEWTRTYGWTIVKSVAPASHSGFSGDTFNSLYTVTVDQTVTDSGFKAFGTISVVNPAGAPSAITVNVADAVSGVAAVVDCDAVAPDAQSNVTVQPGETKACSYAVDLPDATNRTNTATVTFNQIAFPASAAVTFGAPTVVGFPTINVSDVFDGAQVGQALGTTSGDETFTYSRPFSCPTEANAYTNGSYTRLFPNIARIIETGQQDDASVTVDCELKAGLGDLVWVDFNQNGQQDAGEPGIPGVTVELLQNGTVIGTKVTDANGNYAFTGLEAGTYTVRFPTIGLTLRDVDPDATDSDADPANGQTTTTLDPGEFDPTLDAGYLPAKLGDLVWEDDGNGIQQTDEPMVPGVTVNLLQGGNVISTTTTGADGTYRFENLTPGVAYQVCFILPEDYDEFAPANQGEDGAMDSDADTDANGCTVLITLDAGENDPTWDAGLVKTGTTSDSAELGDYVWEDKDEDGLQDADESGVPGVTVNLLRGGDIISTTVTDANGKYLFAKLTPGAYEVCFVKPQDFNFATKGPDGGKDGTDSDANQATGCTGPITLGNGESDLSWDAGLVKTVPTGENEENQPGRPRLLYMPTLQSSGGAVQ